MKNLTKLQAFHRLKGATLLHVEDENCMDLIYVLFLFDVMYTRLYSHVCKHGHTHQHMDK